MGTVLAVYDVPNWALHNIAGCLQKYSTHQVVPVNIDAICGAGVKGFVHWLEHSQVDLAWCACKGVAYRYVNGGFHHVLPFAVGVLEPALYTSRSKHQQIGEVERWVVDLCSKSCGANAMFAAGYEQLRRRVRVPCVCTHVGIDPDIFHPVPQKREGGRLKVGLCASSNPYPKWRKRFDIYNEIVKQVKGQKLPIDFIYRDIRGPRLSYKDLAVWFHGVDVILCTSDLEGGPMPIIEGVGCGKAVVTTPVGCTTELLPAGCFATTPQEFVDRLAWLLKPDNLLQYTAKCCCNRESWNWQHKIKEWDRFFSEAIAFGKGK